MLFFFTKKVFFKWAWIYNNLKFFIFYTIHFIAFINVEAIRNIKSFNLSTKPVLMNIVKLSADKFAGTVRIDL